MTLRWRITLLSRPDSGHDGVMLITPRELEILRLMAANETDETIAETLVISKKTVQSHVDNVKRKNGLNTRLALVAMAFREGLIDGA